MKTQFTIRYLVCSVLVFVFNLSIASGPKIIINGVVVDEQTKEPLTGASVVIKDKTTGAVADLNGKFQLETENAGDKITLQISYAGYETQMVEASANSELNISLKEINIMGREVVISASRIPERILESPVTIEKMDAQAIKETPSMNFYEGLANLKSVDMVTSSLTYKNINVRGFGNTEKPGFVQLVDGMDNQLPGLNYSVGYSISDLDVDNTELIPGAASALYGANAFNGILNIKSKSPFTYQGFTMQVKSGVNHIDGIDHSPAPVSDVQMRYAKAFNNKFAFKLNVGFFKGSDWVASDKTDVDINTPVSLHGKNNPSYDGLNVYGDEVATTLPIGVSGAPVFVSRTGYDEKDLIDNNAHYTKLDGALHYRITDKIEASYVYKYSIGTTVLQSANRYSLNDFTLTQQKFQIEAPNFFFRTYTNGENSGNTYDSRFLAIYMNNAWKSDNQWFTDYATAYMGGIPNVSPNDYATARAYADIGRPTPGTDAFNHLKDSIASIRGFQNGGAGFDDRTKMYHTETQYNFNNQIKFMEVIAGGSYRSFDLHSNGSLYPDTAGNVLKYYEYGMYTQASKKFLGDRLKLTGSIRYDKSENFEGQFSPRFALVYNLGKDNFVRASYQTAFRMPTSQDQYINVDLGFIRVLGGMPSIINPYDLKGKIFSLESVTDYGNAVTEYINQYGMDSASAAVEKNKSKLVPIDYNYVKPERVQSFELGYRGLLSHKDFYYDLSGYYTINHDFIGSYNVVRPDAGSAANADSITSAAYSIAAGAYKPYQVTTNLDGDVHTYGIALALSYNLPRNYMISGNVTYSKLEKAPYGRTLFNTPTYKTNVGFSNNAVWKHTGFSINWRWTDSYLWQSLFGDGMLAAANNIDAQVSYRLPKVATTVRIGATNVLNYRHTEVYGGSTVGGIYYMSLTYDGIFK
jgi:outer membrane receptor protein involved in Fe transport